MSEIAEILTNDDLLYQLAEEAAELSHAALKLARARKGTNPTPVSKTTAAANLIEEYSDVVQVARELSIRSDEEQIKKKEKRWLDRLNGGVTSDA